VSAPIRRSGNEASETETLAHSRIPWHCLVGTWVRRRALPMPSAPSTNARAWIRRSDRWAQAAGDGCDRFCGPLRFSSLAISKDVGPIRTRDGRRNKRRCDEQDRHRAKGAAPSSILHPPKDPPSTVLDRKRRCMRNRSTPSQTVLEVCATASIVNATYNSSGR